MDIHTVYLDTSAIGGCFDDVFEVHSLAMMEAIRLGIYQGMVSPVTTEELVRAPQHVRELLDEFDEHQILRLQETPAILALERAYMEAKVVPAKFEDDALHIAYATVHGADAVVSWNFNHIVNSRRIQAFDEVNVRHGYSTPNILSPRALMETNYEEE